jgi:pyridinium-3,5-bisthiocarboxylic acid mononucleotide nickel chelatase
MKTLYFDLVSGASGDMILSSLCDIGVSADWLRKELSKLTIPGFSFDVEKQKRSGISASHLVLKWDTPRTYRHIGDLLAMIKTAGYAPRVLSRCESVLLRLGKAEAKVHGTVLEKVHFHEVGAVDTIVDVAGICLGLEKLGIDDIVFSTLVDGKGTVTTQHGVMPVPVPAVAEMSRGFDLRILDIQGELLTPTGCAVLTALGRQEKTAPSGAVLAVGYGCGDKSFADTPNVLRVFLLKGDGPSPTNRVCVLESDMDHISGEIMGDIAGRLMKAGALDVSWLPVFMKKGRPGYRLTVLCVPEKREEFADAILFHTRTLGIRVRLEDRVVAERRPAEGKLRGHVVALKECSYKGRSFIKPEYDSLASISGTTGVPVVELMDELRMGVKRRKR